MSDSSDSLAADHPSLRSNAESLRSTVLGAIASLNAGGVSGASRRLRALAELSGSLTDALSPAEAADIVERQALSALGATSAVVVTLGQFPPVPQATDTSPTLHVVHAIGLRQIWVSLGRRH